MKSKKLFSLFFSIVSLLASFSSLARNEDEIMDDIEKVKFERDEILCDSDARAHIINVLNKYDRETNFYVVYEYLSKQFLKNTKAEFAERFDNGFRRFVVIKEDSNLYREFLLTKIAPKMGVTIREKNKTIEKLLQELIESEDGAKFIDQTRGSRLVEEKDYVEKVLGAAYSNPARDKEKDTITQVKTCVIFSTLSSLINDETMQKILDEEKTISVNEIESKLLMPISAFINLAEQEFGLYAKVINSLIELSNTRYYPLMNKSKTAKGKVERIATMHNAWRDIMSTIFTSVMPAFKSNNVISPKFTVHYKNLFDELFSKTNRENDPLKKRLFDRLNLGTSETEALLLDR